MESCGKCRFLKGNPKLDLKTQLGKTGQMEEYGILQELEITTFQFTTSGFGMINPQVEHIFQIYPNHLKNRQPTFHPGTKEEKDLWLA